MYLAACGSGAARGVAPGDGLQGPASSAAVQSMQPPQAPGAAAAPLGESGEGAGDTVTSAPPASLEGRDRQFEILNEAVSALRQEASRSYERVSDLARETERLRGLLASLQRRLARSRDHNRELLDHVRELEERLQEVRTPPPEGIENAPPSEPPPPSQAPEGPPLLPQGATAAPDSGGPSTEPPGDDVAAPPTPLP
jgi:hypothetical protein